MIRYKDLPIKTRLICEHLASGVLHLYLHRFLEYLSAQATQNNKSMNFLMKIDGRRLFIVYFYLLMMKSE